MDDLNLDESWRIGENSFKAITQLLVPLKPRVIVDFGSGASSVRLARVFDGAKIIAIEHDKEFFDVTQRLKEQNQLENLEIYHRPLRWHMFKFSLYQGYSLGTFPEIIDAVIIDGPPYYSHMGREYCLHSINSRLKVGGIIVLDDYKRSEERRCAQNWKLNYPESFQETLIETDHHLLALEVQKKLKAKFNAAVILDNYSMGISRMIGFIKTSIRKLLQK